jgi:hypothetical protein
MNIHLDKTYACGRLPVVFQQFLIDSLELSFLHLYIFEVKS